MFVNRFWYTLFSFAFVSKIQSWYEYKMKPINLDKQKLFVSPSFLNFLAVFHNSSFFQKCCNFQTCIVRYFKRKFWKAKFLEGEEVHFKASDTHKNTAFSVMHTQVQPTFITYSLLQELMMMVYCFDATWIIGWFATVYHQWWSLGAVIHSSP